MGPPIVSDDIPPAIASRYDVTIRDYKVGLSEFRILTVADPDVLLDAITPAAFSVDERLPYWAELWTSSLALSAYCLGQPALSGRRVLDLGCGLGLTGIAAARNGARVLFADYEPDAILFARWNARTNLDHAAYAAAEFRVADWRSADLPGTYDIVLGADIIYERRNFMPLLACLRATIEHGGEAWLAEPDRVLGDDFFSRVREQGWTTHIIEKDVERRGRTSLVRIAVIRTGAAS